jgi:hypothetical protein
MLTKIVFQVQNNFITIIYHLWFNEFIFNEDKIQTYIDNFFTDPKIIKITYNKEIPSYEKINIFYKDKTIFNMINKNNIEENNIKQKKLLIKQKLNLIKNEK